MNLRQMVRSQDDKGMNNLADIQVVDQAIWVSIIIIINTIKLYLINKDEFETNCSFKDHNKSTNPEDDQRNQ